MVGKFTSGLSMVAYIYLFIKMHVNHANYVQNLIFLIILTGPLIDILNRQIYWLFLVPVFWGFFFNQMDWIMKTSSQYLFV